MATTKQYKCACCGELFTAREADRKRGWARFCSKSCKASKQEARTGQYARLRQRKYEEEDDIESECFAFGKDDF